jgi:uracil-DNA glycosylase
MGELHGQRLEVAGIAGVPTYHPAAALRQGPSVVQVMRDDLGVVKELLNG